MRFPLVLLLAVVYGCEKTAEKASEKALEAATGGKVKIDDDKVTIKTKDGTATYEGDGETVKIKTKDGTFTFGQGKIPEGFPLPVFNDSKVLQGGHSNPEGKEETFQVVATVSAPINKVAEFYEKACKDKGLKVERMEMKAGDAQTVILNGKSDKVEAVVSVAKKTDSDDTTVSIVWTNRPSSP